MTPEECRSIASEGERSLRGGDAERGIKKLERALCNTRDLPLQCSLHSQLGNAYYARGDYKKARDHHMADRCVSGLLTDELQQAKALSNLSATYVLLSDFDNAIECANNVINIARKVGDKSLESRGLYNLGLAYLHCATHNSQRVSESCEYRQTEFLEQSVECFKKQLVLARERQDRVMCGLGLGNVANAYFYLGKYELSIEHHRKRIELATELGDHASIRRSYSNIGNAYTLMGDFEGAAKSYRLALELARDTNDPEMINKLSEDLENVGHILAEQNKKADQLLDTTYTSGCVNSSFGTVSTNLCLSDAANIDGHSDREEITEMFDHIARMNNKRIADQEADFKLTTRETNSLTGSASSNSRHFSIPRRRFGNMMKSLSLKKIGTTPKRGNLQPQKEAMSSTDNGRPQSSSSLGTDIGKPSKKNMKL